MWLTFPFGVGQLMVLLVLMMEGQSDPNLVPEIPNSVELGVTSTYNLWEHALRLQKDEAGQPLLRDSTTIQTLLSPDDMKMVNLVPMDAPHPLYGNADMRREFLLDYMIQESVSPDDPRMTKPEGLSVNNLNGKVVTFKKDQDGNISVNNVAVLTTKTLEDGITIYKLSDLLFDHQERVRAAFDELIKEDPHPMGPFSGPEPPFEA